MESISTICSKERRKLSIFVDYRGLNKLLFNNSYLVARIDNTLDQLATAKVFTKSHLRSGYLQIKLSADSISLTAFSTKYGHFRFLVLIFGLCNAVATFMDLMI